jgi:hypothetical protein
MAVLFSSTLMLCASCEPLPGAPAKKYWSEDKQFFVRVNRADKEKKIHVFEKEKGKMPVWSIDIAPNFQMCVVSNDGETVAVLWRPWSKHLPDDQHNAKKVVLSFWHRQRGPIKEYQLDELCEKSGQVGQQPFFRGVPTAPWFMAANLFDGDTLRVRTIDHHEYEFSLLTGETLSAIRVFSPIEKVLIGTVSVILVILLIIGFVIVRARRVRKGSE